MVKELLDEMQSAQNIEPDEELIDTLIAVSVVAKRLANRLAMKLRAQQAAEDFKKEPLE